MSPAGGRGGVERDPEVGKVTVAEVLDNVGEPLRGEPAVVGEEHMRLLVLGSDSVVAASAGACGAGRQLQRLEAVHGVEHLEHGSMRGPAPARGPGATWPPAPAEQSRLDLLGPAHGPTAQRAGLLLLHSGVWTVNYFDPRT
jgi:hypothetical protein